MSGGQLDEPPVAVVEVAVPVQPGDEEAVRGAALLEEGTTSASTGGSGRPPPGGPSKGAPVSGTSRASPSASAATGQGPSALDAGRTGARGAVRG